MNDRLTPEQFETVSVLGTLLEEFRGGVIIGGVAVSLLANPRYTKDVDAMLMLDSSEIEQFLESANQHGFVPRFSGMAEFGRQSRLLVLEHKPTGVTVDIPVGTTPFEEETLQRSQFYHHEGFDARLPSPEDLIIMKGIAHREQDIADIRAIAEVYPELDRGRIQHWLKQYAELLDSPD